MKISKDDYYKVLGLFHLASEHQRKCTEYEVELSKIIGDEMGFGSYINDAIYNDSDIDEALQRMGIEVEEHPELLKDEL